MKKYDVIVIGAGASGLYCATTAGYRGKSVLVVEHSKRLGRKILMSGGGRCNFTNIHTGPKNFISKNAHFTKSALSRFNAQMFIEQVERHAIDFHEKTLGQLFCDTSSKEILQMLLTEAEWAGVEIQSETSIEHIARAEGEEGGFKVQTSSAQLACDSLVVATGGLSIPNGGATPFAYQLAEQFGLNVTALRAALVPFTLPPETLKFTKPLSGVSHDVSVTTADGTCFKEAMLFTHRGLSGPVMLQASSYWNPGEQISINLFPEEDALAWLKSQREAKPNAELHTVLAQHMTKRMAQLLVEWWQADGLIPKSTLGQMSNEKLQALADLLSDWRLQPGGTEGYRTAEVTLGGIDTDEVSSKTFEAKSVPGLYFVGECLDVTGHLGGHNFQWAWASGFCAGGFV
ncbi:MAG: NAD(P)/FAD-dependent oxidoreductase [Pseudomonadales bacterium]